MKYYSIWPDKIGYSILEISTMSQHEWQETWRGQWKCMVYVAGGRDWGEERAIWVASPGLLHMCSLIYSSMRSDLFIQKKVQGEKQTVWAVETLILHSAYLYDIKESDARCCSSTLVTSNVLFFACSLTHCAKTLRGVPSRELTYPSKMAFWRWFSFSPGGIC